MNAMSLEGEVRVAILYRGYGQTGFDMKSQTSSCVGAIKLDHPDLIGLQNYKDVSLGSDAFEMRAYPGDAITPFTARARKIPGGFLVTVSSQGKDYANRVQF